MNSLRALRLASIYAASLALTLAAPACGGGGSTGGATDMAVASADLVTLPDLVTRPDMVVVRRFGCSSALACVRNNMCMDQPCIDDCIAMINTMDGEQLVTEYLTCLQTAISMTCKVECGGMDQQACAACAGMACAGQTSNCTKDK